MKLEAPDELLSDCCTELEAPGELVGEHRLEFVAVVEIEALVYHLLGPSDSLSGEDLEALPGSLWVAWENWMALDSPHHSGWMQVLDGYPAGYEDSSGKLYFKNANCHVIFCRVILYPIKWLK